MEVTIIDTRPDWMRKEDNQVICMRCPLYRRCASRFGADCKRNGGLMIPKIRG
jgi:hypothetical protein